MEDQVSNNIESDNSSERGKAVEIKVEDEGSRIAGKPSKRRKTVAGNRRTSYVWKHFNVLADEVGNLRAKCKYCKNTNYRAESYFGTSNFDRHLKICKAYKAVAAKNTPATTKAKTLDCAREFDHQVYCKLFADAIVSHNYDLSIVEDEGMRKLHEYLNPKVNTISRNTILKDVEALVTTRKEAEEDGTNVDSDCDSASDSDSDSDSDAEKRVDN